MVMAGRNISLYKSLDGDHRGAVQMLEAAFPMVQIIGRSEPYFVYEHFNSFAVELSEVGRVQEAGNIIRLSLASPYVFAYPEWRETGNEIALREYRSRSIISFRKLKPEKPKSDSPKPENLFYFPERERSESIKLSPFFQPSDVTKLEDWQKKMVKEPNGNGEELPKDMSAQDMAMKVLELITENKHDEEKLRKLMESAIKIFSEKK